MNRSNKYLKTQKNSGVLLSGQDRINDAELRMAQSFPIETCGVSHDFVPGMYIRTAHMKKGQMVSSHTHLTEHPYVILKGAVSVQINDDEWELKIAGDSGITLPNTHRFLFIHEDCDWRTFHVNPDDCRDVETIMSRILKPYDNPLLGQFLNKQECLT